MRLKHPIVGEHPPLIRMSILNLVEPSVARLSKYIRRLRKVVSMRVIKQAGTGRYFQKNVTVTCTAQTLSERKQPSKNTRKLKDALRAVTMSWFDDAVMIISEP